MLRLITVGIVALLTMSAPGALAEDAARTATGTLAASTWLLSYNWQPGSGTAAITFYEDGTLQTSDGLRGRWMQAEAHRTNAVFAFSDGSLPDWSVVYSSTMSSDGMSFSGIQGCLPSAAPTPGTHTAVKTNFAEDPSRLKTVIALTPQVAADGTPLITKATLQTTKKPTTRNSKKTTAKSTPKNTAKAASKATASKATASRAAVSKGTATKLTATKPTVTKPTATKPTASKPTASKPTATKPTATKPTATKPTATKPTATKPTATKPTATKPTATKPTASKATASKATASKATASKATASKSTASKALSKGTVSITPKPATRLSSQQQDTRKDAAEKSTGSRSVDPKLTTQVRQKASAEGSTVSPTKDAVASSPADPNVNQGTSDSPSKLSPDPAKITANETPAAP